MIEGRVAKILSDEEVVLNVGKEDGAEEGMEFVIYSEGEHVFDPVTGDDLGLLETVKGRVEVTHVMSKMSRASTLTYKVRTPSYIEELATRSFWGGRTQTRRRKLKVAEEAVESIHESREVEKGDLVRSVKSS